VTGTATTTATKRVMPVQNASKSAAHTAPVKLIKHERYRVDWLKLFVWVTGAVGPWAAFAGALLL
jgi:hypothetical protein